MFTCSDVSNDLDCTSVNPLIQANAAHKAISGPLSLISIVAASLKWCNTPAGTELIPLQNTIMKTMKSTKV